jgi:hypothetical protein
MRFSNIILYGFVVSPIHKAVRTHQSVNKLVLWHRSFTEQLAINQVVNKFSAFMELEVSSISSPKAASGPYPKLV